MRLARLAACAALAALAACASDPELPQGPPYQNNAYRTRGTPAPQADGAAVHRPVTVQAQPGKYDHLPQGPNVVLLEVRGMTCPVKCTREVKEQLAEAPGVRDVFIDYDTRVAIVKVEEGTDPAGLVVYVRPPYSAHVVRR